MPLVGLVVLEVAVERTMVAHSPVVLERLIRDMLVDQVLPMAEAVVADRQRLVLMVTVVLVRVAMEEPVLIILLQARL
jgi:uncharacterized protein (DUF2336 family)